MKRPRRPDPPPMQTDDVRVLLVGTLVWALAFVGLLAFYPRLAASGHEWWLWTCAAGVALGLLGAGYLRRRRAPRRR